MTDDPQVILAIVGALSAIIGAAIGSIPAFLAMWLTKRSEERKHLRDLILRAAIEDYKADREFVAMMTERFPARGYETPPLAEYIIGMSRLAHVVGQRLSPEQVELEVADFQKVIAAARKHWESGASPAQPRERPER